MNCSQNCQQGRTCDCRLDEQPSIFETICDFAVAGIFAVGTVTTALVVLWLMWRWFV